MIYFEDFHGSIIAFLLMIRNKINRAFAKINRNGFIHIFLSFIVAMIMLLLACFLLWGLVSSLLFETTL